MYKSCRHALHGLCFYSYAVVLCCYSPNEQINGSEAPVLFRNYNGEIIPKSSCIVRNATNSVHRVSHEEQYGYYE